MPSISESQLQCYADLLIHVGVNLQPGQCLRIGGEIAHREMIRRLVVTAYRAGAPYVHIDWQDLSIARERFLHVQEQSLEYLPDYEIQRHRQMVDEGWARLALVGDEFPDILADVDPTRMRRVAQTRSQKLRFYTEAIMANQTQWCVAAVPTPAWAAKVFPDLAPEEAVVQLWQFILHTVRADAADPAAAWQTHNRRLKSTAAFLERHQVRALHFFDSALGPDGKPATDLTIGMTDRPRWIGGSSPTPKGIEFQPNMPTEEIFSTPHNARTQGYVRTSKPTFPFERQIDHGYFRFEAGEVVEFDAENGRDTLEQFFQIDGARRLGEVALVEVTSPVSQAGRVLYEILFDENAACHIAFGEAYPEGVVDGRTLSAEELRSFGVNRADTHLDVMIGTPTMSVIGLCADGSRVSIMENGVYSVAVSAEGG
jgi:aminopeptidase